MAHHIPNLYKCNNLNKNTDHVGRWPWYHGGHWFYVHCHQRQGSWVAWLHCPLTYVASTLGLQEKLTFFFNHEQQAVRSNALYFSNQMLEREQAFEPILGLLKTESDETCVNLLRAMTNVIASSGRPHPVSFWLSSETLQKIFMSKEEEQYPYIGKALDLIKRQVEVDKLLPVLQNFLYGASGETSLKICSHHPLAELSEEFVHAGGIVSVSSLLTCPDADVIRIASGVIYNLIVTVNKGSTIEVFLYF